MCACLTSWHPCVDLLKALIPRLLSLRCERNMHLCMQALCIYIYIYIYIHTGISVSNTSKLRLPVATTTILYHTILYCIVLYYIILYHITLYYIILGVATLAHVGVPDAASPRNRASIVEGLREYCGKGAVCLLACFLMLVFIYWLVSVQVF